MSDVDNLADLALAVVQRFASVHGAAAIPALFGACTCWAVQHGVTDVLKDSLEEADKLADNLNAEMKRHLS